MNLQIDPDFSEVCSDADEQLVRRRLAVALNDYRKIRREFELPKLRPWVSATEYGTRIDLWPFADSKQVVSIAPVFNYTETLLQTSQVLHVKWRVSLVYFESGSGMDPGSEEVIDICDADHIHQVVLAAGAWFRDRIACEWISAAREAEWFKDQEELPELP